MLLNEIREHISLTAFLTKEHKIRLLKRLEKLQLELHKKVSSLDSFWGFISESGVILGKFGENAKPLFDRFKEMAEIVWSVQTRTEELPGGTTPVQLQISCSSQTSPEKQK